MTDDLGFRLKVGGRDEFDGAQAISTSYRFEGILCLEGEALRIAWSGQARVQDVGLLSVSDDRLPLPAETLLVPLARLLRAKLVGGWWRPRLAVSARDLRALAVVPSEEFGTVQFYVARRDRKAAAAFAALLSAAIGRAAEQPRTETIHLSDSTPVTPPASPSHGS